MKKFAVFVIALFLGSGHIAYSQVPSAGGPLGGPIGDSGSELAPPGAEPEAPPARVSQKKKRKKPRRRRRQKRRVSSSSPKKAAEPIKQETAPREDSAIPTIPLTPLSPEFI